MSTVGIRELRDSPSRYLAYVRAGRPSSSPIMAVPWLGSSAIAGLDHLWSQVAVVEIDADLMHLAADLADRFDLRGYDSVHCASGVILADDEAMAAAGDRRLLGAWVALGLATFDTNQRLRGVDGGVDERARR